MDTHQAVELVPPTQVRLLDASKYNLRCNRNVSEKMTKKDFIYDIRAPAQIMRKFEVRKRPIILPIQIRRKQNADARTPQYTVISEKMNPGDGNAAIITDGRALDYECNFCHEPIATSFSLSTHVKFHCLKYCKVCYWILRENETMEKHVANNHRVKPEIHRNL